MFVYELKVTTGDMKHAGTWDHIYVTLIGTYGDSERTELDSDGIDFKAGDTVTYTVKTTWSLGELLLVQVEKDPYILLPVEDQWYCSKIVVTTPRGDEILFPCYLWMSRGEVLKLRGGRATKVFEDEHPLLIDHRQKQLIEKKNTFKWKTMAEGLPHHFDDRDGLPADITFSESKSNEMFYKKIFIGLELKFKGLFESKKQWEKIEDMKNIFWFKETDMSEYVANHWEDDDFFGYQFLNALNPNVIKRCSELPPNFPVTDEMVQPFLGEGTSLQEEIKKGNIFIYDQKKMDGIPPRKNDGEPLTVTPGLCLFHLNKENKLMPIAIQLQQKPSKKNPIFLPSDSKSDWTLAKMFLKNADLMDHQSVHHLMKTHLLAEAYFVATNRCLPEIHPIYKLLIQHFRDTIQINTAARRILLGPDGPLSKSSLGYDGLVELMRRGLAEVTYSSLCLPENIAERGLESVPNYHYRDDGLKLWAIIRRFVKDMVKVYYHSNYDVRKDTELQDWIKEIFTHAFLKNKASGFPESFSHVDELIEFVTMVIFNVTVQHAAVNNGQFDYHWVPNGSLLLVKPPPTIKGQSSMKTVLETIPNIGRTAEFAAEAWLLSQKYTVFVSLGHYPEDRFDEPETKNIIKRFQAELAFLSEAIQGRNSRLKVPYTYLDPIQIENSIAI